MRANILVRSRVFDGREPFLPLHGDQRRQQRARIYGWVHESAGEKLWVVPWDNGQITREKSTQLAAHLPTAGLPPPTKAPHASDDVGVVSPPSQLRAIL